MNILVTGSSGYIGKELTQALEKKSHTVLHLSRSKPKTEKHFQWNPEEGEIDIKAIESADAVIHLAGENIGSSRWTKVKKTKVIESRQKGTNLLIDSISKAENPPKIFISASATGYYGAVTTDTIFAESAPAANDFLGYTTQLWEKESLKASNLGLRTVIIRTGVVISKESKALQKMAMPVRAFVGANLGSGNQYIPWIDLEDLVGIYLFSLETSISGIYNAVAPQHLKQKQFNQVLAKHLKRPLFLPPVPEFLLKMILGEMAVLVTKGSRISAKKIMDEGFRFKHETIESSLRKAL
ncbi:MAG: TIGR01777 family oxidoreductase [Bacteroidales bacterium]|nr:TIGR01777 family oxidoreductase [Bacteroidales bacterium]